VVCAQAFHWFANAAALTEIHRVLRPGGMLGLVCNVRDEDVDWRQH
jgi:SAM-dependent methyltransferase